jgi:hypothetical protein
MCFWRRRDRVITMRVAPPRAGILLGIDAMPQTRNNQVSLGATWYLQVLTGSYSGKVVGATLKLGLWRSWERASMAWKRSTVRTRPGPPQLLKDLQKSYR